MASRRESRRAPRDLRDLRDPRDLRAPRSAVLASSIAASLTVAAALLAGLAACGGSSHPCDGSGCSGADAGMHADAEAPDTGPPPIQTGVAFNQHTCKPCAQCPTGQCLTDTQAKVSFCADRCDADLLGCPTGFTCFNAGASAPEYFCVPPATCQTPGVGYGTACYGDAASCLSTQTACEGDVLALGYCTNPCTGDADCPPGFACGTGSHGTPVCQARYAPDAERCARGGVADEVPCSADGDCAAIVGAVCVRDEPSAPGVCATPCSAGGGACAAPAACLATRRGLRCLPARCTCHGANVASGARDLLGEALDAAGLTRCSLVFSVLDLASQPSEILDDPYRLSFFDAIHNAPLTAVGWANDVVRQVDDAAGRKDLPPTARAAQLVERLATLIDRPVTHQPPGALDPSRPLATAVEHLISATGGTPDTASIAAAAAPVPLDLQLAVATVLDAIERAAVTRAHAVAALGPGSADVLYTYAPAMMLARADGMALDPSQPRVARILNQSFPYGDLYGASADVLDAIAASDLPRFAVHPTATTATTAAHLLFAADTPIGRIAIGDGNPGIYDAADPRFAGPWALLVDLGGNDVYRTPVAGNVSLANAVSVLVDLGGDDDYGYAAVPDASDGTRLPSDGAGRYHPIQPPSKDNGPISFSDTPRQGGARLGVAILADLGGGHDRYRSLRMSQGSGILGAGVLVDDGGDDVYLAEAGAQGAGLLGIGLLLDLGGDDQYRAYTEAQGFAFTRGAGLLHDASGDDTYAMDVGDPAAGGDPLYFVAQRPGAANATLGQGFGFGRRADTDTAFMSGGLGILVDAAGRDRYQGSIFAQGGGYWFGTGILADEAGDDRYDGLWYAMGAAAHYALGFLLERGGDDVYGGSLAPIDVTLGAGHDYSAAFLVEESGNDVYHGARIALGAGDANGIGVFTDNAGDDRYLVSAPYSLGAAGLDSSDVDAPGSPRRKVHTVGVFIDAGGRDAYFRGGAAVPGIEDGALWSATVNVDPMVLPSERGVGIDGDGESTIHTP